MSTNALLNVIKEIANEAVDSKRPMKLLFGEVTQESPLQITVEQKKVLNSSFLVLCRNVTDYEVDMTVDHITEDADTAQTDKMAGGGGDPSFTSHLHIHHHKHPYKGRKTFLVHNALKMGEHVALLQMQGGQTYLVIDRVGL